MIYQSGVPMRLPRHFRLKTQYGFIASGIVVVESQVNDYYIDLSYSANAPKLQGQTPRFGRDFVEGRPDLFEEVFVVSPEVNTPPTGDDELEPVVTISWCANDLLTLRPSWSLDQRASALHDIGNRLEERSIELGWGVLEDLLDDEPPTP